MRFDDYRDGQGIWFGPWAADAYADARLRDAYAVVQAFVRECAERLPTEREDAALTYLAREGGRLSSLVQGARRAVGIPEQWRRAQELARYMDLIRRELPVLAR